MEYTVPDITAEQIVLTAIGAFYYEEISSEKIEKWLGVSASYANNAAKGAYELKMVKEFERDGNVLYLPILPICKYMSISKVVERPIMFRQQLIEYEPFLFFKERIVFENDIATAARQTKSRYAIGADWNIIQQSLTNWGAYAGVFTTSQGRVEIAENVSNPSSTWLEVLKRAGSGRDYIVKRIGSDAADIIERGDLERLATLIGEYEDGSKLPKDLTICLVGIADVIFTKLAKEIKPSIDLTSCQGIMQLFDKMKSEDIITKKHLGFGTLIGQIRNAVDHDIDRQEREAEWEISMETSRYAFEMVLSAIRSIVAYSQTTPNYIL